MDRVIIDSRARSRDEIDGPLEQRPSCESNTNSQSESPYVRVLLLSRLGDPVQKMDGMGVQWYAQTGSGGRRSLIRWAIGSRSGCCVDVEAEHERESVHPNHYPSKAYTAFQRDSQPYLTLTPTRPWCSPIFDG